jgi:hypothetical protein
MALLYRKTARDFVLSLLAANFNPTLNDIAETYGITPFTLDFSTDSIDFAVSHIEPRDIETCQIQWSQGVSVGGCLYTTDVVNKGDPKQWSIAAQMFVNLDFYVLERSGVEGFNTEDYFDAIEEAAVVVIQNLANQWPAGVVYSRRFEAARQNLIPLGDGFASRIPIKFLFEVYVQ